MSGPGPARAWVDSHCHLQLGGRGDAPEDAGAVLARARAAGVDTCVCVGTDLQSSRAALDLSARHAGVHPTVGLHPHEAVHLAAEWEHLEALSAAPEVVAIGEAGFDLHYEHSPRHEQEAAFRWQIRLARRRGRALVVHSREAWDDTFRVLDDEGPPAATVFHCFTGGPDEARRALELGAHLSFSGIVTFPGAHEVRAAAALVPADRLLVETDAPYLAPVPHRGRVNEPGWVPHVGLALAEARGEDVEAVAVATVANARRVFGLA